ncbi:hypothetical protein [Nonomuraea jabiensis]|uniref:Uncharacterized protein n=1 Tax=Nonomuraea jabiensis TaxID=882448 RepID=A0A7W9LGA7_9ACTN|nr:hypothetical protein [Nonomuraea jabiensis]MBB5782759.1 hypothetical protein [Nonomuraea jabiensis]
MPTIQLTAPSGALPGEGRAEAQRELARALPGQGWAEVQRELARALPRWRGAPDTAFYRSQAWSQLTEKATPPVLRPPSLRVR